MFTNNYILNPNEPIKLLLIGCGGTGSYMLPELAGLSSALKQMGKLGFKITVMDDDLVEDHNIGRQRFSPADIGLSKAKVLATRVNRFYGNGDVTSIHKQFCVGDIQDIKPNVIITAVDKVQIRKDLSSYLRSDFNNTAKKEDAYYYWIDTGNAKDYGQIVIGAYSKEDVHYKSVCEIHPDMEEQPEQPSCSVRQSLSKQSYMINKIIGSYAVDLISTMMIEYHLKYNALYVNLAKNKTKKLTYNI